MNGGSALRAFAVFLSSFVMSASIATAVEVDGIAATVGTESILRSDVMGELARMGATDGQMYGEVLNRMIDRKLILKAARESKMTMQEWVVENRIREIIKMSFGGDRNKLIETLGRQKLSYPEWYARTKEDMIVGAMRWQVVDKNVTAAPGAMRREYAENQSRYVKEHKVSVSVILLKPEEHERRVEILAELKGKTFEELGGKKYENVKAEELFKPEICAEIAKLRKGELSHWVELDGWSFLLRKDDEVVGARLSFEEAYDAVEAAVKEQEARRLYEAWTKRLREATYIKVF